jgi:CBS domain-containing protein
MDVRARDLMTADVKTVAPDDAVSEVLTRMSGAPFNGYPVAEPIASGDRSGDDGTERLVGIVTQRDVVELFQPSDRTIWIPIGLPPFLETIEYPVDLSWDALDTELDLLKNADRPVREVMTRDVQTVGSEATLDEVLDVLAADEADVNRVPVVEDGTLIGIITRDDVLEAIRMERRGVHSE